MESYTDAFDKYVDMDDHALYDELTLDSEGETVECNASALAHMLDMLFTKVSVLEGEIEIINKKLGR